MRKILAQMAPPLRRYAHALLASWPVAPDGDDGAPRARQDADDLAQEALLGFWRAGFGRSEVGSGVSCPDDGLRLALYRRVTALARQGLARKSDDQRRPATDARVPPSHRAWAPEARALPRLSLELRATLALVTLERLTYEQAGEALDMPVERVLARLAAARARLAGEISGSARSHLAAAPAPGRDQPDLPGGPVTGGDLHRFVDDLLDDERREEISLFLENRPDMTRRAAEWRRQSERLRRAFEPLLREPLPLSLDFFTPDPAFWAKGRDSKGRGGFFAGLAARFAAPAGRARPAHRPI